MNVTHFTIRQMRAAVSVANHRSFRRAAEELHMSQPALSLAIAELERQLGVTLFDRTSRSVLATEVGSAFVHEAARLLHDFDQLAQDTANVAHSPRGRVAVSCVASVAGSVLPAVLRRCLALHPQIQVTVRDAVASQVIDTVRQREADFGVTMAPGELGDGMSFEPLHQDPLHVVIHRHHRFARKRNLTWNDLNGESLIALSTSAGAFQMVQDELMRKQVKLIRSIQVAHVNTLHAMVEAELGVSIMPALGVPIADHPRLTSRPLIKPALMRTIGVYRRCDRSLSPAATVLLDIVRAVLRELNEANQSGKRQTSQGSSR